MKRVTLVAVNDGKTFPNVSCALIYLQAQIEASIKGICRELSRMDDPGAISEYLRQNKKILAHMLEIELEIDEGLALMSETKKPEAMTHVNFTTSGVALTDPK